MLLLDAGVECHNLYTADVTRTMPVSGKFSPAQRRIYELVLRAQKAGIAAVKPGVPFMAPNDAAMKVLAEGLHELGILQEDPETALRKDRQLHRRYTLHGVSHMLGLDVHDCARARAENYKFGRLQAGAFVWNVLFPADASATANCSKRRCAANSARRRASSCARKSWPT